ncbi:glycosyltransferase family 4 protein [candidate division KSB1 bacterium]|nr:glycosyltransferase family 4 protein [candidate division KSB1 bacterium]
MSESHPICVWMIGLSDRRHGGVASVLHTYKLASWFRAPHFRLFATCLPGHRLVRWSSALRLFSCFVARLTQSPPSLVHIHLSSGLSFWRKAPYILAAHLKGVRILVNIHPTHFYDFFLSQPLPLRWLVRRILLLADAVGFPNPAMIPRFVAVLPGIRLCYLPNPIDLGRYRSNDRRISFPGYALFLGTFSAGKGIETIIAASSAVLQAYPEFRFVLCGMQESQRRDKRIQALFKTGIDIRPWVNEREKLELLRGATVLLLPSKSEGFPVIVAEALACGVPVICSAVGGLEALLRDRREVLMIRPQDGKELQEKLCLLLGDPTLQAGLGERGAKYVKRFDVETIRPYLLKLYTTLLSGKAQGVVGLLAKSG